MHSWIQCRWCVVAIAFFRISLVSWNKQKWKINEAICEYEYENENMCGLRTAPHCCGCIVIFFFQFYFSIECLITIIIITGPNSFFSFQINCDVVFPFPFYMHYTFIVCVFDKINIKMCSFHTFTACFHSDVSFRFFFFLSLGIFRWICSSVRCRFFCVFFPVIVRYVYILHACGRCGIEIRLCA